MPRSRSGFTLIEMLIALVIAAVLGLTVFVVAGRKLVDDGDPVRLLKTKGYVEPKVIERHNFNAWNHGCTTKEKVSFKLTAVPPSAVSSTPVEVIVCCGEWFDGCIFQTPP